VGNCGATRDLGFGSRGRRDLVAEAGRTLILSMWELPPFPSLTGMVDIAESEAGLKWEAKASLGPLLILDTVRVLTTPDLSPTDLFGSKSHKLSFVLLRFN